VLRDATDQPGTLYAGLWIDSVRASDGPVWTPQYPALSYQIAFLFLLGATLARYATLLERTCKRIGRWLWLVLAVSMFLYFNFILTSSSSPRLLHCFAMRIFLINGLGSAGILICSLHLRPLARILKHTVPEYLGRISYSLYLVHAIVLFTLVDLLYGHVRPLADEPLFHNGIRWSAFVLCCRRRTVHASWKEIVRKAFAQEVAWTLSRLPRCRWWVATTAFPKPSTALIGAEDSGRYKFLMLKDMAESEGFEPPIALRLCLISSQVHSTGLCQLSYR
jgi:hypothetical protein